MSINDKVYGNFRRNLQLLRVGKGLTTQELSEMIGANSKKRIVDLEYGEKGRGIPKMDEIVKLSEVFSVTIDELLTKSAVINFI